MAQWMGVDTAKQERIPWVVSDKRFINGMFNKVLRPMEKQGVDFWWLDWQQWMYDKKVDSLSNTWWINYVSSQTWNATVTLARCSTPLGEDWASTA